MKIFVCEFITGGGLHGVALPDGLSREGSLMLHALIRDLHAAGYADLVTTRDARVPAFQQDIATTVITGDPWPEWRALIDASEAAIIIAPETDQALYRLTSMAEERNCRVFGCDAASIATTGSKQACRQRLAQQGVAVPRVLDVLDLDKLDEPVIIKPDDGVGGEEIYYFQAGEILPEALRNGCQDGNYVLEVFVPGAPASMSLLCYRGSAQLLAVNRQLFELRQGRGVFEGVIVNNNADQRPLLSPLAADIARAIPGLGGIVGVDFIMAESGPVVIEVNPRLTTAYAGLGESLGYNPAALLMDTFLHNSLPDVSFPGARTVPVRLAHD